MAHSFFLLIKSLCQKSTVVKGVATPWHVYCKVFEIGIFISEKMLYKQFYSELGKLLYAVADIDKVITQEEKKKLLAMVKDELVPHEKNKDQFDTNIAFYTEIEFDVLEEQIADAKTAFNSFLDFVDDHYTAFDERMKNICVQVAKEIARAYNETSKNEKKLLHHLINKLGELEKTKGHKKKQKL